jgi:D-alanyl-D-alanine carboxypeptidase
VSGDIAVHALEVTDKAHRAALAKSLKDEKIDVLINNAGIGGEESIGGWLRTLHINCIAPNLVSISFQMMIAAVSLAIFFTYAGAGEGFRAGDVKAITSLIEKGMAEQRQPGLIVSISVPGRGSFVRAFGEADLQAGARMDVSDHIRIASITKTFTAVATLRLVDQGKLGLEDRLSAYVDGIPNGSRITIRNLLGMTSGVYDLTSDKQFLSDFTANPMLPFSTQDAVSIIKRHAPEFEPNEKVSYCDSNYILLGMILEKTTGKPLNTIIQSEILDPVGLHNTTFPTSAAMPAPFAHGYFAGDDGKGNLRDYTETNPAVAWSAGAMISTVEDLSVWAKALASGALLKPETHAKQIEFGWMTKAGDMRIGYGLGIANFGGLIGHNGAIFGYSTAMFYLPAKDATIVLAGNQASNFSNATTEIAIVLARYLLPEELR